MQELTTYRAIRALLGVEEISEELPDSFFDARSVLTEGSLAVRLWVSDNFPDQEFQSLLDLFDPDLDFLFERAAAYECALLVLPSLQTLTASSRSDGQDEFQRESRDLQEVAEGLRSGLSSVRRGISLRMGELFGEDSAALVAFSAVGVSSPSYDPVTNS